MSEGYVYILSNESMPGLLKIGKTTRDVEARAHELYQTGVPTPFKVEHFVRTPDCDCLEKALHSCLPDLRVSSSREFFKAAVDLASSILDECLEGQLKDMVQGYMPDFVVTEADFAIDADSMTSLAYELDCQPATLRQIMMQVTAEELRPAMRRLEQCEIDAEERLRVVR